MFVLCFTLLTPYMAVRWSEISFGQLEDDRRAHDEEMGGCWEDISWLFAALFLPWLFCLLTESNHCYCYSFSSSMEGPVLSVFTKKTLISLVTLMLFSTLSPVSALVLNDEHLSLIWRPHATSIDPIPTDRHSPALCLCSLAKEEARGLPGLKHCRSFLLLWDTSSAD